MLRRLIRILFYAGAVFLGVTITNNFSEIKKGVQLLLAVPPKSFYIKDFDNLICKDYEVTNCGMKLKGCESKFGYIAVINCAVNVIEDPLLNKVEE